jgi:hypothetical protein
MMQNGKDDNGNGMHGEQKKRLKGQGGREKHHTDVKGAILTLGNDGTVNVRRRI